MEVLISVSTTISEYLIAPIGRQFGYLFCYNCNIRDFANEIENLGDIREGVQGLVDAAERKGEIIFPAVRTWLTKVDDISQESKELVDRQLQARKQLCNVYVPNLNLKSRHQRSRLAKKKLADAEKLKLEGNGIHTSSAVSYPAPPLPVGSTTSAAEEGGAGDFGSRQSVIKQIMEAIKDDQINTIGIYGLGGVGKTTLVKQVGKQAQRDNLFDEIVMALVSQTPDLKRIQDEIADIIGLKFEEESVAGRARRLFARIEEKTSFLVILDDVWDRVELEAIGIPSADRHKGCKVILTSRRLDVCNQMDSQKNFCVQVLSEKEGWNLFVKMAGEAAEYPHLRTLAVDIAKECGGLPLAIVTIARALRKKSQSAWIDAANQLGESMPDDKVFSTLEMSYKYIESEEAKSIFLLCSIIPKDWYILVDDLLVYGMGLGLFPADTVEKARTRAYALVESLKDSSLLQDGGSEGRVKMHDVIRDVAKSIASKGTHVFLIRNDTGTLNEWPKKDSYQPYTTISISSKDIRVLPDGLECANLETLFLRCQCLSLQIKDNFFLGMKNLKVVHMSNMHLPSLPTSIQCLQNLRTLYLSYCCCMKDISSIGELINLQVLSLRGSHITELPKIIGTLTGLRLLDLTGCEKLSVIPPDVIRGLSQLEALYMRNSFDRWGTQVQGKNDGGDASLGLGDLNKLLTTLEILIPNSNCLPETSLFQNLSRFKISIGSSFGLADQYLYSKGLKLKLDMNTSHIKGGIKVLLKKAEHVRLEEMKGSLKSLLYDIDCEGFPNLRCLNVKACDELQHMFSAAEWVSPEAFSVLEKLDLSNLPALTDICHGHLRYACFENLRVLEVGNCDSLKYLFSNSIAKDLSRLQELSVTSCKLMEEIFVTENEEISIDEIALPDLRCLKLEKLPNLKSFGSKMSNGGLGAFFNEKVAFHKLEKLHISGPTKLRHLFSPSTARDVLQLQVLKIESCEMLESIIAEETEGQDEIKTNIVFPQLQTLELKQLPNLATFCVCGHIHIGSSIQPLFNEKVAFHNLNSLDIYDCNSLKCLFSPNVASSFVRLLQVKIDLCEMIEAVIASEREGEEKINIVFSQLSTLKLHHLPNLTSFYRGRCTVKWPSLKTLQIWSCSAMKTFTSMDPLPRKLEAINQISEATAPEKGITKQPFFELTVALPNLEILSICNMKNLAEIFQNQLQGEFIYKLTHLIVWGCHRLSTVVPWNLSPNLIRLSVKRCNSIQKIFQRPVPVEKQLRVVSLSQLEKLELEDLPNLKIVCKADFKLECPSLTLVQLKGCYMMETFSSKFASTPKLKAIKIEDGQELWNNNLNYTVQQLFCEKKHLAPVYDAKFEGDRLKGEGLYKEALSQFELALNISQGMSSCEKIRSVCHFNRGWCLFELKDYVDTIKECTYALELDSTYRDALFDRGLAHEKLGHFEEAITDVKKVLELEPSEERAKVAIIRLEPLAAEEQEIKEAGLGPTYDAYLEGEKLRFKKLYEEALAQFEMGLQVAPEGLFSRKILSQCHFKRGWCFYDLGNYEDAIKENTKALELDPTYWNALFERGLAHEKLENFEAAIADMRKTLELNPSDVGAKRSILLLEPQKALAQANDAKSKGDKLCSENLYEEALSQYELALQVVPEVSSTMEKRCLYHYKRAWCFFELRKYEEAIKECTNALVLNPTHTNALFERGMAHERLEQFEEAITDVKEVLELEPSNGRARVDIIRLELLVAEKRQIKEDGLGPTYDAYSMGEKLRGKKLYEEALSQFDVALQVAPDVLSSGKILSKCHFKRGWCFYALGKHEDEIKEYTKALELNPTYKDVLFERAIAYEKLERFEEAIFDLKKVLQMESSEERAKIAILRLQHMAEEVQEIKKAGLGPAYEAKLEGNKLFRNGLYNESLSKYENFMLALQAAPEMPSSEKIRTTCHYNRAWCFYELGKYEDAIKENTKALELDPTYRDALFERGLAHEKLENIETAIADMKKVLELDPSYAKAKNALLRLEPVAAGQQ